MSWPAGEPVAPPVERPRLSLRVRLIGLVVLVTLIALTVLDLVLPRIVRGALVDSLDQSLTTTIYSLQDPNPRTLAAVSANSPLKSGIGWTVVRESGITQVIQNSTTDTGGPDLPDDLPTTPTTIENPDGSGDYRIMARLVSGPDGAPAGAVVVWTNLSDIEGVIAKLAVREILLTVGLLVVLGVAASLLIRRELKPLEKMADVADSIAAGDLSRRAAVVGSGAEMDRLGVAFNGMLDGIDALLADRRAAEHRLRQFVADASHELRTPVAAVRGYTDLYAAGALPEPPAVGRAMERMGFESRRMGSLVEDLLTLVQADTPGSLVMDTVDLRDVLTGVVDDASAIDGTRQWQLAVPDDAGPALVRGDAQRLHQLFANLLGNVRAHTAEGSTAVVGIEPAEDPRCLIVTVSDDGEGVEAAALPFLFDRFYRADPSRSRLHGGSGLGLAIVAAIAGAHGGAVSAAPSPTGGLQVRVLLRRAS